MTERMEVVSFETGRDGRVRPRRWGTAVPRRDGNGYSIYLTMPWGEMELVMQPPRDQQAASPNGRPRDAGRGEPFNDDMPFAPEVRG